MFFIFKTYEYSFKATVFSFLMGFLAMISFMLGIGTIIMYEDNITPIVILGALLFIALSIWLFYLSNVKSQRISENDFERKVSKSFSFAMKMYKTKPHLSSYLMSLNPNLARIVNGAQSYPGNFNESDH